MRFMAVNAQRLTVVTHAFQRWYKCGRWGEKYKELMTASM